MKLLERILLATDFSESSENVLENAINLAKTINSKISIVHVLPDDIKNKKIKSLLNKAAINRLDAINERIKSEGIKTDKPILEYGILFEKIILTADSINANVIFIGAGEKSNNEIYQLGTTAENIIRRSNTPVWVVKNSKPLKIDNILCPVDFSTESNRALKNAIIIARRFNAQLTIFSVNQMSYAGSLRIKINWDEQNKNELAEHTKKFNSFLKKFNLTDLNYAKVIKVGDPTAEILLATSVYKTDLLIMGTTGNTSLGKLLMGSVTRKVIRDAPCSFITLKTKDIIELKLKKEIRDIEGHYDVAVQLTKDGFLKEAIKEFLICLNINDMHIPSLNGIAKAYEMLGDNVKAKKYKNMAKEVMDWMWDRKIEDEIRKYRSF